MHQETQLEKRKEAAEVLAYCSSRKILHSDLGWDNVLLNTDLDLCLCHFSVR